MNEFIFPLRYFPQDMLDATPAELAAVFRGVHALIETDSEKFICFAIAVVDVPHDVRLAATRLVHHRLGISYYGGTAMDWLFGRISNDDLCTIDMQQWRLAWLEQLIEEFKD